MNKKFLSAILFGALMVTSTGTFVSCKDYEDDIKDVQEQVDANKAECAAAIKALQDQATALQSALATAQSTADAAKKAAADTIKSSPLWSSNSGNCAGANTMFSSSQSTMSEPS